MTNVYIDAEYLYTVAIREDQVPNYKMLIENLKKDYSDCIINVYFIGLKEKKRGVMDFLHKMGVNYVHVIELPMCSKVQVMGSVLAWDVCESVSNPKVTSYVFVSGDDYLVPIIYVLRKEGFEVTTYYFPLIFSRGLKNSGCKLIQLSNSYLIFGKDNTDGNGSNYTRTKNSFI